MTKKEVIKALKDNIKFAKGHLKDKHTQGFIDSTKGLIGGYEFAIALLNKNNKEENEK